MQSQCSIVHACSFMCSFIKHVSFPTPVVAEYATVQAMAHQHHEAVPFTVSDFERPAVQDEGPAEQPSTSGNPRPSVYELIWHASDSSVKPIVANRRIERLPEPKWDAHALPFKPLVGPCQTLQTGRFCPWGPQQTGIANSCFDALLSTLHCSCITTPLGCNIVSNVSRCRHTELDLDTPSRYLTTTVSTPAVIVIIRASTIDALVRSRKSTPITRHRSLTIQHVTTA